MLEGLAESLYLEQEYAAAGRAARTASWIAGNVLGDWAVQSGWLGRARSVLTEVGEDSPEHGWALVMQAFRRTGPGCAGGAAAHGDRDRAPARRS